MAEEWEERYKEALRTLLEENGRPVEVDWQAYSRDHDRPWGDPDPDDYVSVYGWTDYEADRHCRTWGDNCFWVVPPGSVVREKVYSQFTDTFHSNENEAGINATECHCACGKYENVYLRWDGTMGEAIKLIFNQPDSGRSVQL